CPPSEKLSGVTFTMPITSGRRPSCSERVRSRQVVARAEFIALPLLQQRLDLLELILQSSDFRPQLGNLDRQLGKLVRGDAGRSDPRSALSRDRRTGRSGDQRRRDVLAARHGNVTLKPSFELSQLPLLIEV